MEIERKNENKTKSKNNSLHSNCVEQRADTVAFGVGKRISIVDYNNLKIGIGLKMEKEGGKGMNQRILIAVLFFFFSPGQLHVIL